MTANICAAIGAFVAVACILAMLLVPLAEWLTSKSKRATDKAFDHGVARTRQCLRSDAWWFSEDEATMRAVEGLAKGEDVGSVREKWRQARKAVALAAQAVEPEERA